MIDESRKLTITTKDGEKNCEILFTYHSPEFDSDYVVFVEEGTNQASAAAYTADEDGHGRLEEIKEPEVWTMLEEMLNDYFENQEKQASEGCSGGCAGCSGCGSSEEDYCDDECGCEDCQGDNE